MPYTKYAVNVIVCKDESALIAEDSDWVRANLQELAPKCTAFLQKKALKEGAARKELPSIISYEHQESHEDLRLLNAA